MDLRTCECIRSKDVCCKMQCQFQCGVYDFTGEELFHFDIVRQFTVYEEDEYSHIEQLHCELLFKPTDELRELEVSEWSMDYDELIFSIM